MNYLALKKMLYIFCLAVIWMSGNGMAEFKVSALPDAENPKTIVLENDSLSMTINMDWQLSVPVMEYKPLGINFIQPNKPMPLVQTDSPWILNNVGFAIRTATVEQTMESAIVSIEARSNYVENPFLLLIRLSIAEEPTIDLNIRLVN